MDGSDGLDVALISLFSTRVRDDRTNHGAGLHTRPVPGRHRGDPRDRTGTPLAVNLGVMGAIWVTDREPGIRTLFGELIAEAEVLDPAELEGRLAVGLRPDALVLDGTQFLALSTRLRRELQALPRLLICTGISLSSLPIELVAGPGVAILGKPFGVDDLEAAVEWLRDGMEPDTNAGAPVATLVQRRRPRTVGRRTPAR